jgi:hypothetical protein
MRFDPRRRADGQPALVLDSGPPKVSLGKYVRNEARYRMTEQAHPDRFKTLIKEAEDRIHQQYAAYEQLAGKAE